MDTLSKRYACPFLMLDDAIRLNQLHDFIVMVINEAAEDKKWDFFLHKVFNQSWDEFNNNIPVETEIEMTTEEMKEVVTDTRSLLDLF